MVQVYGNEINFMKQAPRLIKASIYTIRILHMAPNKTPIHEPGLAHGGLSPARV